MKLVAGDKQIQDLTPKTTNLGDRLVKNMRICGSGIYTYAKREAPLLHLDPIPEKFRHLDFINVYRPPEVLRANKDKFARVPIITGHHVLVNRENAKQLVVGMVGDTVDEEVDAKDGELYLYTTGTIVAGDGVDAYEQFGQLSVGYDPRMEWSEGVHNGIPYQARLVGFEDVNHLLICKTARGGPQCMVMDSLDGLSPLERIITSADNSTPVNPNGGGRQMFLKIFGNKQPKIVGDSAVVSTLLQSIAVGADPTVQVPKIKQLCAGDETFNGYLDELAASKGTDLSLMAQACDIVDKYYKDHFMGDEKTEPDEGKKPDEKKESDGGKKPAGDEKKPDDGKKPAGDEKKPDDGKKPAGDEGTCPDCGKPKSECTCHKSAGDEIDYDLIAQKTAAILMAAQTKAQTAGDEAPKPVQGTVILGGDATPAADAMTSDKFMEMFN